MNDSQYHQLVDELLVKIEESLDECDVDIDYESAEGILTIIFVNGSKIIINKQAPLHQVWVATKYNGHHFAYQDEKWIDVRSDSEFWNFINEAASKQADAQVNLG